MYIYIYIYIYIERERTRTMIGREIGRSPEVIGLLQPGRIMSYYITLYVIMLIW